MSKYFKATIGSLILAVLFWYIAVAINPSNFEIVFFVGAMAFSILFVCFLFVAACSAAAKRRNKIISPYKLFAAADLFIGIITVIFSIWNIKTDVGFFAGLLGFMLLLFVVPTVLFLLVADAFLWWLRHKYKNGSLGKNKEI